MAKLTKPEIVEKILETGIDDEFEVHVLSQEFVVTQLRMINDPTDDDMVEIQNNTQLLEHMQTPEYKENFKQIFREEYLSLDQKSLEFIYQATQVTQKIRSVERKSNARIEEMINSLDFLVEVEGKQEQTTAHKVLH